MPTTETRRLNPLILWSLFLAVIALGFIFYRSSAREVVEIKAAAVTRQNLISSIPTNGKVDPIDEFHSYAPAAGLIAKVYVDVLQKANVADRPLKTYDSDVKANRAAANSAPRT